jgi:hypothetical protein
VEQVDVDHVDAEPLAALLELGLDDRPGEDPSVAAVLGVDAQLRLDRDRLAPAAQGRRDPSLALAIAVDRRRVDEGQAVLEAPVDRRDGLVGRDVVVAGRVVVRRRAVAQVVAAAELPGPEADLRDRNGGLAERSILPACPTPSGWAGL